jgi:hypothetical protein
MPITIDGKKLPNPGGVQGQDSRKIDHLNLPFIEKK